MVPNFKELESRVKIARREPHAVNVGVPYRSTEWGNPVDGGWGSDRGGVSEEVVVVWI